MYVCFLLAQIPKRRMTWGGKLLQAALPTDQLEELDTTGLMEPFVKQRRVDLSAIVEQEGEFNVQSCFSVQFYM